MLLHACCEARQMSESSVTCHVDTAQHHLKVRPGEFWAVRTPIGAAEEDFIVDYTRIKSFWLLWTMSITLTDYNFVSKPGYYNIWRTHHEDMREKHLSKNYVGCGPRIPSDIMQMTQEKKGAKACVCITTTGINNIFTQLISLNSKPSLLSNKDNRTWKKIRML